MMFITQYPSLHLENKTRARGGDFKLQLCLFMISIVPNYAGDDDDHNDTPHKIDRYDYGNDIGHESFIH